MRGRSPAPCGAPDGRQRRPLRPRSPCAIRGPGILIDDPGHPREQGRPHHDHAAVLADSPFSITERVIHRVAWQVDIDAVVGHEASKSSSSPARLGERYPDFRAALEDALAPLLRNGALDEVIDFEALICRPAGA